MPLPQDFKLPKNTSFDLEATILDFNVNTSDFVQGKDKTYPKAKGSVYVDVQLKIKTDSEHKGKTFIQENINASIYKTKDGKKSQMYRLLELAKVKEDVLNQLCQAENPNFNLMALVGKDIEGVRFWEDRYYLDLRDPNFIKEKKVKETVSSDLEGFEEEEKEETKEEVLSVEDTTSLFDE